MALMGFRAWPPSLLCMLGLAGGRPNHSVSQSVSGPGLDVGSPPAVRRSGATQGEH